MGMLEGQEKRERLRKIEIGEKKERMIGTHMGFELEC